MCSLDQLKTVHLRDKHARNHRTEYPTHTITQAHRNAPPKFSKAKHETTKTRSLTQREHVRTVHRPETDYASIGVYLSSAAAASQDHGTRRRGRVAFAHRA